MNFLGRPDRLLAGLAIAIGTFHANAFSAPSLVPFLFVAQEVLAPEAQPGIGDDLDLDANADPGRDGDERNVDMDLEARGPLRATRAELGNWFDVTEDGQVSEVLRRHWVRLSPDQRLRGRISTLDNGQLRPCAELEVQFLQQGQVIEQATTDSQGRFEVRGLDRGTYCVIAKGRRGFLAYSINVVRSNDDQARVRGEDGLIRFVQLRGIQGELRIDSVAVPPTFKTVKNLLRQYNIVDNDESRLPAEDQAGDAAEADGEGDLDFGAELPDDNDAAQSGLADQENIQGDAPATTLGQHVVYLTAAGKLVGKLTSIDFDSGRPKMVEDVTVHIIRNDRRITSAPVNRNGVFEIPAMKPGSYSLVATGRSGFGAIGFELRSRERQVRRDVNDHIRFAVDRGEAKVIPVQRGGNIPFPIAIALIDDPRNIRTGLRGAPGGGPAPFGAGAGPAPAPGPIPVGGGGLGAAGGAAGTSGLAGRSGFGGGSGGFSGGGGIGSGLGAAVLGAGGLAAGVGAIVNRNDNDVQVEDRMMSPFMVNPVPMMVPTPVESVETSE